MLEIRDAQLRAFQDVAREELEARTATKLARLYPRRAARLPPGGMRTFIRSAVYKALDRGISLESEVLGYAGLMFLLGVVDCQAGEPDWAAEILDGETRGFSSKLDEIRRRMSAGVRRPPSR